MALKTFEDITEALTDTERDAIVPILLDTLKFSNDKNAFKGKTLVGHLRACGYHYMSESRLRKLTHYIRVRNLSAPNALIATSKGYFMSGDVNVIEDQIESLIGRIESMKQAVEALRSQLQNIKNYKRA